MHGLTTKLMEHLADVQQTDKSAPTHRVTVYRKRRSGESDGMTFDPYPFVFPEVTGITLKRQWNMAADELSVSMSNNNGYYSPEYSNKKRFTNVPALPLSGYTGVISAFNRVECELGYGGELIRMFTGQIQNVDITENPPSISFNARNMYRKLLKPIDPIKTRNLVYEGESAFSIVKDLCRRAGIDKIEYDSDTVNEKDYSISKASFQLGMNYSDALSEILKPMNHRITCGRDGRLQVIRKELYSQQDFHNWEFDDFYDLSNGSYQYDPSILRNRVIIKADNGWQAFEDPWLIEFCNGEIITSCIETKWAETPEQKWAVADDFFLTMRRRMRRITVAVRGNPAMDIGDLVKMRMLTNTANGKYMITSIQSEFSEKGYVDIVDLEYADATEDHLCQPAEGEYSPPEEDIPENDETAVEAVEMPVVMTQRDRIVDFAKSFLGIYYQWGGNWPDSGYGLDCSHFTYQVLKKFGLMDSYRVAAGQKNWAASIARNELLPGDLVFYTWGTGSVKHVEMYIGNGQTIGANGGGPATTTIAKARSQNALVKIQQMRNANYYGRAPGLN